MKPLFFSLALVLSLNLAAQENFDSDNKNEFGLDVTGFIRFFTQFQANDDYAYNPVYYLTYRRLFDVGNIRFGIGGDYDRIENSTGFTDSLTFMNQSSAVSARLGWEWQTSLSKRWLAYYGADFKFTYSSGNNEANYFNGGYAQGYEYKARTVGFSPVLGIRFKINSRISLLTEASLSFYYLTFEYLNKSKPLYSGLPEQEDTKHPTTHSFYTTFQQPISVYFVFNF